MFLWFDNEVLTYLITYLLTYFLTYLLTYLLTFFLSYLLTYLLTSCDHDRDENEQVISSGSYSPLCSPIRVCQYRYPSQVFPDSWVAFFLIFDVGETRSEGQIWFSESSKKFLFQLILCIPILCTPIFQWQVNLLGVRSRPLLLMLSTDWQGYSLLQLRTSI